MAQFTKYAHRRISKSPNILSEIIIHTGRKWGLRWKYSHFIKSLAHSALQTLHCIANGRFVTDVNVRLNGWSGPEIAVQVGVHKQIELQFEL